MHVQAITKPAAATRLAKSLLHTCKSIRWRAFSDCTAIPFLIYFSRRLSLRKQPYYLLHLKMRLSTAHILSFLLPLLPLTSIALNIIVNNDDGFGSANIRELYRLLNAAGHNAWIVAPVSNQSGKGGTEVFTTEANLTAPSEYDLVPKGAPSFGTDPSDSHIWYYNGTPATCTFFALDYVVPNYWNGTKPDLLVSGPNFGDNLGPFLYTLSGTIGATYAAVERSLPAIAFSGGNNGQRSYKEINKTTPSGYPDPATIDAQLSVALVNQLAKNAKKSRLLPLACTYSLSPFSPS